MVGTQQVLERLEGPLVAGNHVQQHRVAHAELTGQLLWLRVGEPLVGRLAPGCLTLRSRTLAQLLDLLRVASGALAEAEVLDLVFRGLDHDGAFRVVARAACSPGDLVELAGLQHAVLHPVVLREPRHQYGADRHVDAHAQGVGAADDLQQALLG